ncbi:MAG TPA: hypothetical protein VMF89_22605 [Polyangiales bacterium]|nr:hypothetical protein [Polyangiales bacterium]
MISRRVVLFGAVVAGVSYVLAMEHVSREGTAAHSSAVDAPNTAELPPRAALDHAPDKREIHKLAADLERMRSELSALRDDQHEERAASERPEPVPKTDEQLQAEQDEQMAAVERAFEQQPRDVRWAQGTAQRLRETLEAEPIMLAALHGIECRSTACRLELRDDGSTAFAEQFPLVMHDMGAVLPEVRFSHAELSDGARLHVMYMQRGAEP